MTSADERLEGQREPGADGADAGPVAADGGGAPRTPERRGRSDSRARGTRGDAERGAVPSVIRARALTKRYGDVLAVDHLNLDVRPGEVFGLLGPNGAGKTTTILMLLGLSEPTDGRAEVAGFDPTRTPLEVKRRVG